jgi:hypothetical protein
MAGLASLWLALGLTALITAPGAAQSAESPHGAYLVGWGAGAVPSRAQQGRREGVRPPATKLLLPYARTAGRRPHASEPAGAARHMTRTRSRTARPAGIICRSFARTHPVHPRRLASPPHAPAATHPALLPPMSHPPSKGCFNLAKVEGLRNRASPARFQAWSLPKCATTCSASGHAFNLITPALDCHCGSTIPSEAARLPESACAVGSGARGAAALFYNHRNVERSSCRLAPVAMEKGSFNFHYSDWRASFDGNGTMTLRQVINQAFKEHHCMGNAWAGPVQQGAHCWACGPCLCAWPDTAAPPPCWNAPPRRTVATACGSPPRMACTNMVFTRCGAAAEHQVSNQTRQQWRRCMVRAPSTSTGTGRVLLWGMGQCQRGRRIADSLASFPRPPAPGARRRFRPSHPSPQAS